VAVAVWENELDELMRTRGSALVRYAYMLSGDRALAEDLVQDALVKVYSRLRGAPGRGRSVGVAAGSQAHDLESPSGSPFTNAEGYVRRAVLTIYLDGYRKRQRWSGVKHLLSDDVSTRGADQAASTRVDVMAALAKLGARERACVVLRYFEDMTVPQIADALGTAQGTVKRYLSDATKSLQEILRPDDFLPAEGRAAR
jgi:RNA polymerase sigma factor (sigma-70 family)